VAKERHRRIPSIQVRGPRRLARANGLVNVLCGSWVSFTGFVSLYDRDHATDMHKYPRGMVAPRDLQTGPCHKRRSNFLGQCDANQVHGYRAQQVGRY
jgi:hypothetical protein